MFFTRIGTVLANLLFWLGLFGVLMSILFLIWPASIPLTTDGKMAFNPAKQLDSGLKIMLIGIALGMLSEISGRINKQVEHK